MRLNSCSDKPSSTAARRRVTYLISCVFMFAGSSRRQKDHSIFFNCQDHGLVDVHVPAVADTHAHGVIAIPQQLAAQRHLNIAQCHLEDDRLTNPNLECAIHSSTPSASRVEGSRSGSRLTMVQGGYGTSKKVPFHRLLSSAL